MRIKILNRNNILYFVKIQKKKMSCFRFGISMKIKTAIKFTRRKKKYAKTIKQFKRIIDETWTFIFVTDDIV